MQVSSRQSWLCLSLCSFTFLSFLPLFSQKLMNPKVTLISVTSEQKIRTLALYEHRSQTFALIFLLRQRLLLFSSLEMRGEDKRIHSGDENEGCFSHRLQWRFSSLLQNKRKGTRKHKNLIKSLLIIALYSACENRLLVIMSLPNFRKAGEKKKQKKLQCKFVVGETRSQQMSVKQNYNRKVELQDKLRWRNFILYLQFPGTDNHCKGCMTKKDYKKTKLSPQDLEREETLWLTVESFIWKLVSITILPRRLRRYHLSRKPKPGLMIITRLVHRHHYRSQSYWSMKRCWRRGKAVKKYHPRRKITRKRKRL